jgi:hypothetical protein
MYKAMLPPGTAADKSSRATLRLLKALTTHSLGAEMSHVERNFRPCQRLPRSTTHDLYVSQLASNGLSIVHPMDRNF